MRPVVVLLDMVEPDVLIGLACVTVEQIPMGTSGSTN
jgi:hypothetical protein